MLLRSTLKPQSRSEALDNIKRLGFAYMLSAHEANKIDKQLQTAINHARRALTRITSAKAIARENNLGLSELLHAENHLHNAINTLTYQQDLVERSKS